jgi:hypothetical protein
MQIVLTVFYITFVDVLTRRWLTVLAPLWMSLAFSLYLGLTRGTYDWVIVGIGVLGSFILTVLLSCIEIFETRKRS